MTQTQLKSILTECGNTQKLQAVKAVMDFLNQKERRIGLKEAKDMVDAHWGNATQEIPTNVTKLLKDIRSYGQ